MNGAMRFDWTPEGAPRTWTSTASHSSWRKAFGRDPLHVIIPDRIEDGEQRWHAIGLVGSVASLDALAPAKSRTFAPALPAPEVWPPGIASLASRCVSIPLSRDAEPPNKRRRGDR